MGHNLIELRSLARNEARSFASRGIIPGHDRDDLTQEAWLSMYLAVATGKLSANTRGRGYLQTTARNCLTRLMRQSQSQGRLPHDERGMPMIPMALDDVEYQLPGYEMLPEPPDAAIPPCHPRGEDPEGYAVGEPLCANCPDKFSCLVETEAEGRDGGPTIEDDPEVLLVVAAAKAENAARLRIAHEIVTERQRRRVRLRTLGRPVPDELDVRHPLALPPMPDASIPRPVRGGPSPGAPTPAVALREPPGMPTEKKLSPSELAVAIARVRIGQPMDLDVGHVLVRQAKGIDVCVEIRVDGFWLNLNGRTYGSHSSAAKAAEVMLGAAPGGNRPGNDYFSIVRHHTTEIRDAATGAVLACRRGVRT